MVWSPKFGPDGNMIYMESDWVQDFRLTNLQTQCRGICYEQSRKSFVYLGYHESLAEILDSCTHESIHMAIRVLGEDENMDIDEEHELMRRLMMCDLIISD